MNIDYLAGTTFYQVLSRPIGWYSIIFCETDSASFLDFGREKDCMLHFTESTNLLTVSCFTGFG